MAPYFLFRRRKTGVRSDTGGTKPIEEFNARKELADLETVDCPDSVISTPEKVQRAQSTPIPTPARKINRSLSGVETAPIDIIYPPELRSVKSTPVVIPDEELDQEIEKIKSMRSQYHSPSSISARLSTTAPSKTEKDNTEAKSNPETGHNGSSITVKETFNHSIINSGPIKKNKKMVQKDAPSVAKTNKKNKSKNKEKKQQKVNLEKSQNEVAAVEQKMTTLKITETEIPLKEEVAEIKINSQEKSEELNDHHKVSRKSSGRDSANHSPSDVMMGSSSLSSMSDNHSEGSSDSGKGGSDVATPPSSRTPPPSSRTPPVNVENEVDPNMQKSYEFIIPQSLVGKLIGRHGTFIQSIKDKCNTNVSLGKHPSDKRFKICCIEGNQTEIDKALKMIRNKFPVKKYSELTLEQVKTVVPTVSLTRHSLFLKLVEAINNDTVLSHMDAPNHLFMHLPTHPSFPATAMLTNHMNSWYNMSDSPLLPSPIAENTICVAYTEDGWYRAMVLSSDDETDTSYIQFLDDGGYAYIENDKLRQIRQDYLLLPFQAAECYLSNIKSKNEDDSWPEEAYTLVNNIAKGSIIYTQIISYCPDGITPLVYCYVIKGGHDGIIFLNRMLVEEGYAEWIDPENIPESTRPAIEETVTEVALVRQ
ncbi:hypothetical protein GWI33_021554 [Rhynchophorus ferrugineus]|uniref:Tudor domain-containing protein n=1 Tax=Rhynchophorus ferrugineus TaxID=354439 RepID=A0A834IRQ8_RHYFE|nr:hypothetical protein GWI33_021554 [Rhynchophorus ferrugineus]